MTIRQTVLAVIAVAALASGGCASGPARPAGPSGSTSASGAGGPVSSAATPTTPVVVTEGVGYVSTAVSGRELVPGTRVELTFRGGQLTASARCNTISGGGVIEGDRLVVSQPLAMTAMGCLTAGQGEQDSWLMSFLAARPTVTMTEKGFVLAAEGVRVTMQEQQPTPLVGITWELTSTSSGGTSTGWADLPSPRMRIDGRTVSFNTGCNIGSGTVSVGDRSVVFGPLVTTLRACESPLAEIEGALLTVMSGTVDYRIAGKTLTLDKAGSSLTFVAAEGDLTPQGGNAPTSPGSAQASPSTGRFPPGSRGPVPPTPPKSGWPDRSIPETPQSANK